MKVKMKRNPTVEMLVDSRDRHFLYYSSSPLGPHFTVAIFVATSFV